MRAMETIVTSEGGQLVPAGCDWMFAAAARSDSMVLNPCCRRRDPAQIFLSSITGVRLYCLLPLIVLESEKLKWLFLLEC
jgi:hypothetical protein